jgi:hypothetical protein
LEPVWGLSSVAGPLLGGFFSDHANHFGESPDGAGFSTSICHLEFWLLSLLPQFFIFQKLKREHNDRLLGWRCSLLPA